MSTPRTVGTLRQLIALNQIGYVGARTLEKMLTTFGHLDEVFKARNDALLQCGVTQRVADGITSRRDLTGAELELEKAHATGVRIIAYFDHDYPLSLREIYDPPLLLYVRGTLPMLEKSIAVVGSRRCSRYGTGIAEKFGREFAERAWVVVSGLARGIDAAAHHGALTGKGETLAVLGSGVDIIYPKDNESLAEKIAAQGALISEFPLGTDPAAEHFPRRNRIISALSRGIVLIEANAKSGALITARWALEQGRDIFCVPGPIDSGLSAGCHALIQEGAKLVQFVDDIIDELPVRGVTPTQPQRELPLAQTSPLTTLATPAPTIATHVLTDAERRTLDCLTDLPVHTEELLEATGLAIGELSAALLTLQFKKCITATGGGFYNRNSTTAQTVR